MASRLQDDVKSIAEHYRKASTTLADAEILYGRLQREGFESYAADAALRDARRTIREGRSDPASEHLERPGQAFAGRTNARAAVERDAKRTGPRARRGADSGTSTLH